MGNETNEAKAADETTERKKPFPLVEAYERETGIRINRVTVWRYTTIGLCGCLLKRWPIAGRFYTNRESVRAFLDQVEARKKESN